MKSIDFKVLVVGGCGAKKPLEKSQRDICVNEVVLCPKSDILAPR